MLLESVMVAAAGFALSWVLILVLKNVSCEYPRLASAGAPCVGGIGVATSFFVLLAAYSMLHNGAPLPLKGIAISSLLILVSGVWDDFKELSVPAKLLVQSLAVVVLMYFGVRVQIASFPAWVNTCVTFLWVIGITNALNHLDVLDGVAGAVSLVTAAGFFTVAAFLGQPAPALCAAALAGAVAGFLLPFNLPPAKVYLGNAGSHFLGFLLAAISLFISYAPMERKVALFTPVLVLGLPVFDTAYLVAIRIFQGRMPHKKSNDHLALRFLKYGYPKEKALATMALWALLYALAGVMVSVSAALTAVLVLLAVGALSVAMAVRMSAVRIDA